MFTDNFKEHPTVDGRTTSLSIGARQLKNEVFDVHGEVERKSLRVLWDPLSTLVEIVIWVTAYTRKRRYHY